MRVALALVATFCALFFSDGHAHDIPRREALWTRKSASVPWSSSRKTVPWISRRPLILLHDKFFGRDFVSENYTFDVRAQCRSRVPVSARGANPLHGWARHRTVLYSAQ
jgi:hypothetical protein